MTRRVFRRSLSLSLPSHLLVSRWDPASAPTETEGLPSVPLSLRGVEAMVETMLCDF